MKEIERSLNFPQVGKVKLDKSLVRGQGKKALGRNRETKIIVVGIERVVKSLPICYRMVVETASKVDPGGVMKDHINSDTQVKTDIWSGYRSPFSETSHEK